MISSGMKLNENHHHFLTLRGGFETMNNVQSLI